MDMFQPSPRLEEAQENYSKADVEYRKMCYCLGESIVLTQTQKLRQRYRWFDYHTKKILGISMGEEKVLLEYKPGRYNDVLYWNRMGDIIAQGANLLDSSMEAYNPEESRSGFGYVVAGSIGVSVPEWMMQQFRDADDQPADAPEIRPADAAADAEDHIADAAEDAEEHIADAAEVGPPDAVEDAVVHPADAAADAEDHIADAAEVGPPDAVEDAVVHPADAAEVEPVEAAEDAIADQDIWNARRDPRFQIIENGPMEMQERDASSVSNSSLERTVTIKSQSSSNDSQGEEFDGSLEEIFRVDYEEQEGQGNAVGSASDDEDFDADALDMDDRAAVALDAGVLHVAQLVVLPPQVPIVADAAEVGPADAAEVEPVEAAADAIADQDIWNARRDPRFQIIENGPMEMQERDASSVSNSSLERTVTIKSQSSSNDSQGEEFDGSLEEIFRVDYEEQEGQGNAVGSASDEDFDADALDVDDRAAVALDAGVLHVAQLVVLPPQVPIVIQTAAPIAQSVPSRKRREPSTPIASKDQPPRKSVRGNGDEVTIQSIAELENHAENLIIALGDLDLGLVHIDVLDKIQKVRSSIQRCAKKNQVMKDSTFKLHCKRINQSRVMMGIRG